MAIWLVVPIILLLLIAAGFSVFRDSVAIAEADRARKLREEQERESGL